MGVLDGEILAITRPRYSYKSFTGILVGFKMFQEFSVASNVRGVPMCFVEVPGGSFCEFHRSIRKVSRGSIEVSG